MFEWLFAGIIIGGGIGYGMGHLAKEKIIATLDLEIITLKAELHNANKERVNLSAKLAKANARDSKGRFIKRK